jgi:hypothetical protein
MVEVVVEVEAVCIDLISVVPRVDGTQRPTSRGEGRSFYPP